MIGGAAAGAIMVFGMVALLILGAVFWGELLGDYRGDGDYWEKAKKKKQPTLRMSDAAVHQMVIDAKQGNNISWSTVVWNLGKNDVAHPEAIAIVEDIEEEKTQVCLMNCVKFLCVVFLIRFFKEMFF